MRFFRRDDGVRLRVVEGFREEIIARRPGRAPRPEWGESDYEVAAANLLAQTERRLKQFARYGTEIDAARVLEVGCGSGLYSLAMASHGFELVIGIDLRLPLFEPGAAGERLRRLARKILKRLGLGEDIERALRKLPIRLLTMDARKMTLAPDSFDIIWSGACLEHVVPVEPALAEMARVLTGEGLMYHRIDPFFWVRGCHRPGLVEIPWAHARMSPAEYERFVRVTEGRARAAMRANFLQQLNRFTVRRWRELIESGPVEIQAWNEDHPEWVVELLYQYPEVRRTTVDDVSSHDLTCSLITAVLRGKRHESSNREATVGDVLAGRVPGARRGRVRD
jgi:SAM-dependent methyltransferase